MNQFVNDIWEAWRILTCSRSFTMGGAAPIAITELLAYAEYNRIDDAEDRWRLLELISSMDATYLEQANKKEGT